MILGLEKVEGKMRGDCLWLESSYEESGLYILLWFNGKAIHSLAYPFLFSFEDN